MGGGGGGGNNMGGGNMSNMGGSGMMSSSGGRGFTVEVMSELGIEISNITNQVFIANVISFNTIFVSSHMYPHLYPDMYLKGPKKL